MNNKMLMAAVVAVVVLGAGFLLLQNQPKPTTQTTQTPTTPTPASQTQRETATESAEGVAKNEVIIENFAFSPKKITVKSGEAVKWTNKGSVAHTATADDGTSFDTGLLPQGQSGTVKFEKAGTYTYHCTPHPRMQAEVVVE